MSHNPRYVKLTLFEIRDPAPRVCDLTDFSVPGGHATFAVCSDIQSELPGRRGSILAPTERRAQRWIANIAVADSTQ